MPNKPLWYSLNSIGVSRKPAAFDPSQVSGLKMWLQASSLGLANNAAVSSWTDLSGLGNTPTQATGANQPTYHTGILNGLAVVNFPGGTHSLRLASFGTALAQPNHIFVVVRNADMSNYHNVFDGITSGSRNSLYFNNGTGLLEQYSGTLVTGANPGTNTWNIISCKYAGASSAARVNGSAFMSGDAGAQSLTGFVVGDEWDGGFSLNGDIAELLIYNAALSSTDITNIENYLNARYAIF